jgi:hypothetical protein
VGSGAGPAAVLAGPPFTTDDPEPVPLHSWELYLAFQSAHDPSGWSGTGPHFEVNYGPARNTQLHLIVPLAYSVPSDGAGSYGLGDIEVGLKYRFVDEGSLIPQVGSFPLVELPSGSARRGLGAGAVRTLVPLWLQKSWGPWVSYGGAGYWINPGRGHRNSMYLGSLLQRRLVEGLSVGAEVFHATPAETGGSSETGFKVGGLADLGPRLHLIGSAGRGIQGGDRFQAHLALLVTTGPRDGGRPSP